MQVHTCTRVAKKNEEAGKVRVKERLLRINCLRISACQYTGKSVHLTFKYEKVGVILYNPISWRSKMDQSKKQCSN